MLGHVQAVVTKFGAESLVASKFADVLQQFIELHAVEDLATVQMLVPCILSPFERVARNTKARLHKQSDRVQRRTVGLATLPSA